MLELLDGYPISLKCRYHDKIACFTEVYIVTNITLNEPYKNIQTEEPATWQAIKRRIHQIYDFESMQIEIN